VDEQSMHALSALVPVRPPQPGAYDPLGHAEEHGTHSPAERPPHPLRYAPLGHLVDVHAARQLGLLVDPSDVQSIRMIPVVDVTGAKSDMEPT
jgi:hypothetical protein